MLASALTMVMHRPYPSRISQNGYPLVTETFGADETS
jgi:hypothetical protein